MGFAFNPICVILHLHLSMYKNQNKLQRKEPQSMQISLQKILLQTMLEKNLTT